MSNESNDQNVTPFPGKKAPDPGSGPVLNLPPAVKALSLVLILCFIVQKLLPQGYFYPWAFVPARYTGGMPLGLEGLLSPATHMFLHGGILHLVLNVGTLMAFGAGLEKEIGARKFLLLYFASGIFGAFSQAAVYPLMQSPLIGASGGISGLFGGVLMMMYTRGLMGRGYRKLLPFVVIWIGISYFFGAYGMPGAEGNIAWPPHVGGFIAGLLLYRPITRSRMQH